jgi:hypothetical protein
MPQSGPRRIGWIEEVPGVNCQERTGAELLETLEVTVREAVELSRREVLDAAGEALKDSPVARLKNLFPISGPDARGSECGSGEE